MMNLNKKSIKSLLSVFCFAILLMSCDSSKEESIYEETEVSTELATQRLTNSEEFQEYVTNQAAFLSSIRKNVSNIPTSEIAIRIENANKYLAGDSKYTVAQLLGFSTLEYENTTIRNRELLRVALEKSGLASQKQLNISEVIGKATSLNVKKYDDLSNSRSRNCALLMSMCSSGAD
ncbi:MAG: hypothetical protein ACI81T_003503 [Bacteroidia bacterium]|jgi:hypothetical protein